MKAALVKYLSRFSYPQCVFAASIKRNIKNSSASVLIDTPCGTGVTSWRLSALNALNVYAYDISPDSIAMANARFKRNNLHFNALDIHAVALSHCNIKYFCIINSLFLLPEPDLLLQELKFSVSEDGALYIIVPNIKTPGFKLFQQENKNVNKFTLAENQFQAYFDSHGWKLLKIEPIVYAGSYRRWDLRLVSIFAPLYLNFLNFVQSLFKAGQPNYFLLILEKDN
jgi:2-polyprenyl-3-methyl-5-hydroxy-6-metoxy-1,4-benzoquinol methylase